MASRTKDTEKKYYNRGLALMQKAYKEAKEEGHDFADFNVKIKVKNNSVIGMNIFYTSIWACKVWSKKLRASSWSQYRCSIRFIATLFFNKDKITKEEYDKICIILENTEGGDKTKLDPKTSSNKKKSFSKKEVQAIEDFFNNGNFIWSKPTLYWIKAAVYLGLRPIEWKNSEYFLEEDVIVVNNAKNTNGRAIGKTRTLSLKHYTEEEREIILKHLDFAKRMNDNDRWKSYYQGCSNLLKYTTRKIWKNKPRLPTLYSGRHQYSANMKASGCKKKEVAALMGHATDQTATTHYGKKIHGTRQKKPEVNSLDLNKVKEVEKYKFSFKNKK